MAIEFTFKFAKAKAALLYLAQKNLPGFSKGKACKLLFLADKHHMVRHGRPITGDWYAAMEHGPVPSHILNLLDAAQDGTPNTPQAIDLAASIDFDRTLEFPAILARQVPDLGDLSRSDVDSLDAISREYGQQRFTALRKLTHDMPAYEEAWAHRVSGSAPMEFELFFDEDEDARAGVLEDAIEDDKIRKVFPEPAWL